MHDCLKANNAEYFNSETLKEHILMLLISPDIIIE